MDDSFWELLLPTVLERAVVLLIIGSAAGVCGYGVRR
jgi:hypothetical protein